jgi:hypothetical protein
MPECSQKAVGDLEMIHFLYDAVLAIALSADMEDSA